MKFLAVAALAYVAGGLPTADWIAAAAGVDLRAGGSGTPAPTTPADSADGHSPPGFSPWRSPRVRRSSS